MGVLPDALSSEGDSTNICVGIIMSQDFTQDFGSFVFFI